MPNSSDYSIHNHGQMIHDRRRTSPYVEALRRAVKPGDVVVDIGTGAGIFAFIACQLGAARVYAIESDDAIEVAKLCAANNIGSERITWLQGFSTELVLPELADVVIGDLHGIMPFYNDNIDSLIDARKRHLKPGGTMIPERDVLRVVPAQAALEYESVLSPWRDNEYGIDLSAGQTFIINRWWRAARAAVPLENLLAEPVDWGVIDYGYVESANLERRLSWTIERAGTLHGYYVWFDTDFGGGIAQTNTPLLPGIAYGRAFFPLEQAIDVVPGDRVATHLSATAIKGEHVYRWDTRITDATGQVKGKYRQSSFNSRPFKLDDVKRASAHYVPALNNDGHVDLAILQAIAQSQPLGQIAAELVARHPQRFANSAAALDHVARLSSRYAGPDRLTIPK
jgi:protein arginine N-methyltransferase 1